VDSGDRVETGEPIAIGNDFTRGDIALLELFFELGEVEPLGLVLEAFNIEGEPE
jgi:hypothetical protein